MKTAYGQSFNQQGSSFPTNKRSLKTAVKKQAALTDCPPAHQLQQTEPADGIATVTMQYHNCPTSLNMK